MKKQPIFQITIPEPCHENWEAMTAVEKGRFCSNCQKVVTDFSAMEDAEIVQKMQEVNSHCMRFRTEQLNRPLQLPAPKVKQSFTPLYQRIAASLLIVAAFGEKTFAQQSKTPTTQQPSTANKKASSTVIISGHLLDMETQKPVVGMTVSLQKDDFVLTTTTNRWGGFTFSIPKNQQRGVGFIKIDARGTNYNVVDEEVSMSITNKSINLFCFTADMLEKMEIKAYKRPTETNYNELNEDRFTQGGLHRDILMFGLDNLNLIAKPSGGGLRVGIERTNIENTPRKFRENYLEYKPSFWYRITHPFKKRNKK